MKKLLELVKLVKPSGRGAPAAVSGERARPFGQVDYVVFDTETTGLRPAAGDEVVQIAGIRIGGGNTEPTQHFNELVNPGRAIPALGDATMTAAIFLRLLAMARGTGAETIADLLAISNRAKALIRLQRRNWPSGR